MPDTAEAASVVLSTWVPRADADDLRSRAAAGDRTVAAEIRRALRVYLNDERRATTPAVVQEPGGRSRRGPE